MIRLKIRGRFNVKKLSAYFLVGLITITCFGCSKKEDKETSKVEDNPSITVDSLTPSAIPITVAPTQVIETPTVTKTPEPIKASVINNGGKYVGYNDKVYYREDNKDSYDSDGIFGEYMNVPGSSKNMVCKNKDGSKDIAFSDTGFGEIYISHNRMFLTKYKDTYSPTIYSIGLKGENVKEFGYGIILGIDEKSNSLVCQLNNADGVYQLQVIDTVTEQITALNLKNPFMSVVTIHDGVIYYTGEVEYQDSELGKVKLCSVNVDGTNELLLYESEPDLYDYSSYGTQVPCFQFIDDKLYFSYGGYAGTGYFYQGGRIVWVTKDGKNHQVVAGQKSSESYDTFDNLVDEKFYVVKEDGKEVLYYTQGYDKVYALAIATGDITESVFTVAQEGIPFEYEKGIYVYENGSYTMTTWIPYINYDLLGIELGTDDLYKIKDIQLVDNRVYYSLEASKPAPEVSIGWRDGYRRLKTVLIRQDLRGGSLEILNEY